MLVKMLPEQVMKAWKDIKFAIEQSLPPIVGMVNDRMNNILRAIMTEQLIVWVAVDKNNNNNITALVVTSILQDGISGTNSLLIYCLYGYGQILPSVWEDGFKTLQKYAKSKGCHRIIAYSDEESVIKYSKRLGAATKFTLISFPLETL